MTLNNTNIRYIQSNSYIATDPLPIQTMLGESIIISYDFLCITCEDALDKRKLQSNMTFIILHTKVHSAMNGNLPKGSSRPESPNNKLISTNNIVSLNLFANGKPMLLL